MPVDGEFVRVKPHVFDPTSSTADPEISANDIEVIECTDCVGMTAVRNVKEPGVLDLTFDYSSPQTQIDFSFGGRQVNEKCVWHD